MKKNDLIGKTFDLLTVLMKLPSEKYKNTVRTKYKCECACGNTIEVSGHYLNLKSKKSCGCIDMQYKGVSLGYIFGYRNIDRITGIEGIHKNTNHTYTVHINLYDKSLSLGRKRTLKQAIELRELGEYVFYQPIVNEYLKLKQTLKLDDIPIPMRIGQTDNEIIRNYIVSLGTPTQVEIDNTIKEVKEKIQCEIKKEDLSDQTFGELKVLYRLPIEHIVKDGKIVQSITKYRCQCSCGKCKDIRDHSLIDKKTFSCGCLSTERFKGRLLGSILGTVPSKNNIDIEGISKNKKGTYTVHIKLYGKSFNLGTKHDLEDAKKLLEWGENTFYKPISDEYFKLKETLKVEDIPINMRKGDSDEEIISNYLSVLGQTPQEEIDVIIEKIKETISEHKTGGKLPHSNKTNKTKKTKKTKKTNTPIPIGKTFGEITVISRLQRKVAASDSEEKFIPSSKYDCLCSCGKRLELEGYILKSDMIKSCGCILRGQFKGVSLGYILGYKNPTTNTGVIGVNIKQNNKYTVSISLYAKNLSIGVKDTLSEAMALRKWAEDTFYKPVIDEYFDLRENLKVDDIPVSMRKGKIDKEIIGNYITFIGTKTQEQIDEEIKKAKEEIQNMRKNALNTTVITNDLPKKKRTKNTIFKRKINDSPRKVKLYKDKIKLFKSKDKLNPCGCGSQHYYKTDNGVFIIDVCSSCGKDICISPKKDDFAEWVLETELDKYL